MNIKKLTLGGLLLSSLLTATACGGNNTNTSQSNGNSTSSEINGDNTTNFNNYLLTDLGYRRFSAEPTSEDIDKWILDIVIDKGGDLISGGIASYGKTLVINLLKECGLDLRDANAKTLEKIQQQLDQIENKLNSLCEKIERDHSESILSPVLKAVKECLYDYNGIATTGIEYLVNAEKDESLTEEEIETKREEYYNDIVKDLMTGGLPIASRLTNLCNYILKPNEASGNNIFYYYFNTIACTDVWSIQRVKNIKSFVAYIDSVLLLTANLAKFQMYYLAKGKGDAARAAYEGIMTTMANQVNAVNLLFKNQIEALKVYEDKAAEGLNIFLSTGKEYSTRLATLTYNPYEDDKPSESRQGLLYAITNSRYDYGAYCFKLNPDSRTVEGVANSFREYATSYCAADYTIQDYLTFCGFHANNEDLYERAVGLYKGDFNVTSYGVKDDDHDYIAGYYDRRCNYTTKKVYDVATYHIWGWQVDHADLRIYDNDYYLCFATKENGVEYIDGNYSSAYTYDNCYKVMDSCPYQYDWYYMTSHKFPLRDTW